MFLELITPDEKLFEGEIIQVTLPGIAGSFQILAGHAPLVSTLGKGDIKYVQHKKREVNISVDGGVVEVRNDKVNVLIERIADE